MNGRKKQQKPLDFRWLAKPFQAAWACSPEQVPMWDVARGFPVSAPLFSIEIDEPYTIDLHDLRQIASKDSWQPDPAPLEGYPRLVRANCLDAVSSRYCDQVDILNRLTRLLRKEPPCQWIMGEILELHAEVGPVQRTNYTDNTLESWLTLARIVQAHMKARDILDLLGYSAMRDELKELERTCRQRHKEGHKSYATLARDMPREAHEVDDEQEYRRHTLKRCRSHVGKVSVATDEDTLTQIFVATVPLYDWVIYKIGDIWEPSAEIAECVGCGMYFLSRRKGKLTCGGACRNRKHHDKKRESKTTA